MTEVYAFIGLYQVGQLGEIVEKTLRKRSALGVSSTNGDVDLSFADRRPTYIPDYDTPRFRLTPAHFAYVKIAEGCNHPCSFCVIPQMRGKHRSRPLQSVLAEIRGLVSEGVREINLISQDTTYYGMDLWPAKAGRQPIDSTHAPTLAVLLREIQEIEGEFWVRLLDTHPAHVSDEVIETIRQRPDKVARYREAIAIHQQIAHDLAYEKVGSELKLLVDQPHIARSEGDAPDVDARVVLSEAAPVGEFVWRRITGSRGYDLLA